MKRKFVSTVIAAFTFIAMMSVTALANPVATVRLEAGEVNEGQVAVGVYVDVGEGHDGVSAVVVDLTYTGVQRVAPIQRQFTTSDGTNVLPQPVAVTGGIEMGPAFGMNFDQFISPPAAPAPLRLYFEMAEDGVLTEGGRAATITFSVPAGSEAAWSVRPVIHTVEGHQFAYRWTNTAPYSEHLGATVVAGSAVGPNVGARLCGDVDGNEIVDTRDITRLRQYFLGFEVEIVRENSDVDNNGVIDTRDITRLRQYFLGFEVRICHC